MSTRKITRPADITAADAKQQIKEAGFELVSMVLVDASGRKVAAANAVGRSDLQWEATIKVAEFPFDKDGGDEEPKDDAPADDAPKDDEPEPIGGDSDDADEPSEPEAKEPKLGEVFDLLKAIAEHLKVPVPGEDPIGPEGDAGLPPLDAPGGDVPPPPGDEPLPLPVEKKAPGAGGGVFSHIVIANADAAKGRRSFVACVADANVLNDGEIVREAQVAFPGYRVAGRIDRVTLAESNEARVPLTADPKAN